MPLRRRVTVFVMLVTGCAVVVALAMAFTFGMLQWRRHLAGNLATLSQVVAANAAGSLAFQRPDEARAMLSALRAHEEIADVRLLDLKGELFAEFRGRADGGAFRPPAAGRGYRMEGFRLYAAEPVTLGGETYGRVEMTADIRHQLTDLALITGGVMLGVLAAVMVLVYFLSVFLQRAITDPLYALSATAREVALRQDFALRARKFADDEIGDLTDAFNAMLAEVQQRDLALRRESAERLRAQEDNRDLERKLEQKQRLESLGVLAGGIAHDFNNILTGILCSASLGRLDAERGSVIDRHLERIEQNSRRAAELCEQMLAYAGKARLSARVIDLNGLARDTVDMLHTSLPVDAELALDLEPALPAIRGDVARIRQVLMNLILNAAEALGTPPRRIAVRTGRAELDAEELARISNPEGAQPGAFVRLQVSDTGVGIDSDRLRRIFEPFHTSKFAGRGLGLSAVLGIIRSTGGALDVESEVGRGTTFSVYFPSTGEPLEATAPAPRGAAADGQPPAGTGTVIVVDDEAAVRAVATDVLTRMGFTVLTATGGAEAVAAVEKHDRPIAGVLLDLTMPGMDGVATLRALRRIRPGLRAVLMSGYDQRDTLPQLEAMGFSAFVQKPFTPESLAETAAALR
jgi:signal transduction histidine kinase/CheY-like chemotaxis protein